MSPSPPILPAVPVSTFSNVNRSPQVGQHKPDLRLARAQSHLHAVHGLSDLVQVVGGAQRLQADVCQLELLLPKLVLQLEDGFRLGLGAFAEPATRDYTQGGGRGSPPGLYQTHTHTHRRNTHLKETGELKFRGKLESVAGTTWR